MALTNRLGLPSTIVRAVASDPYKGGGDISVTKLIAPPYQRKLQQQHQPVEDVADRIWALMGQIGHAILERVPTDESTAVREERLFTSCRGWTVSGQFDLIEDGTLTDFKFTSVWTAKDGGKAEWEQQLNLLRLLAYRKAAETGDQRYVIGKLQIVAVFRDWRKSQVSDDTDYPKAQVAVIPIPLWTLADTERFLEERVALHQNAEPEPCTDAERWKRPDQYAVMKVNGKRAVKVYDQLHEATAHVDRAGDKTLFIEHRAGEFVRCSSYCSVSPHCPVWQQHCAKAPF